MPKKSLRGAINAHCKSCVYDPKAPGTWLAQVSCCACSDCKLFEVRPTTNTIPESVIHYYGVTKAELSRLRLKSPPEGQISEKSSSDESPEVAAL